MAGNCEETRLCAGMTLVIMDKAKRWFNDFFFASAYTDFTRSELSSEGSLVIAEDESNVSVVQ